MKTLPGCCARYFNNSNSLKVRSSARPRIFAEYAPSSITISPVRISPAASSTCASALLLREILRRMRASTSAGPAVSRMTSFIPHSALTAARPPSVTIRMSGAPRPVLAKSVASDFAWESSRRASRKMTSPEGASIRMLASAGRMRTWCESNPRAGRTSLDPPNVFVSRSNFAICSPPLVTQYVQLGGEYRA
ncbi:unannotated protein [freshwater metagenome]|uniref:Unannotated protein n=1 Tax=freshwater metagenome TaxID=449393 RepID=A0A6J7GP21_9ZZZZ